MSATMREVDPSGSSPSTPMFPTCQVSHSGASQAKLAPMIADNVLNFWLGTLDPDGLASDVQVARWWRKDAAFDALVRTTFEATFHAVTRGEHETWRETAQGRLAYVIALDQFPRNMYRDTADAFAGDARALEAAREGIEVGHDRALFGHQRLFLYMPFMHAETLADQQRSVGLLTAFRDESSGKLRATLEDNVRFAEAHRDIVARWGRFPHRNAQLGRVSTEEERVFLQGPNSSF